MHYARVKVSERYEYYSKFNKLLNTVKSSGSELFATCLIQLAKRISGYSISVTVNFRFFRYGSIPLLGLNRKSGMVC